MAGNRWRPRRHALGVETIDRDIAHHERDEGSKIADGPSELGPVEVVPGDSHEARHCAT
jgi:hypothetical protein